MSANNLKAILSITLDKSSLPQIKKQLLKEALKLDVKLDTKQFENFCQTADRQINSLTHLTNQYYHLLTASMDSSFNQQKQYLSFIQTLINTVNTKQLSTLDSELSNQAANISKISSDLRTLNNTSNVKEIDAKYKVNISDYGVSVKDVIKSSLSDTNGSLVNLASGLKTAGIVLAASLPF